MPNQAQIRKALLKIGNVSDFVKRHADLRVSVRTIYRQREPDPPDMRPFAMDRLARALILEGLLNAPKPKAEKPAKRTKPEHPAAA